jgi:hypothetical protein
MEEQVLEVLDGLIDSRNTFLRDTMRVLHHRDRGTALSRFMTSEVSYVELINRVYYNHTRNQLAANILTLTVPNSFLDPVRVIPTAEQIRRAIESIETATSNCAICQDSISSDGVKIRHCGHVYHRSCLLSWFSMNVRCPVCRHDIRSNSSQEGPASQTPSVSERTSSPQEDQLEETST